jgi:hypothetical protein
MSAGERFEGGRRWFHANCEFPSPIPEQRSRNNLALTRG